MTATQDRDGTPLRRLLRGLPVFAVELPTFELDLAPEEPVELFVDWMRQAIDAGVTEPHAAVLSTVDADGSPSARALLCKDVDSSGNWFFASSSRSRKGRDITANPAVAMTFYWPAHGRQVRVEGRASSAGAEPSAADFLARPAGSRAEALTDRQSEVLNDAGDLDRAAEQAHARLARDPDTVAPNWTLYAITALGVEFWQADKQRRHLRLRYQRHHHTDPWTATRLWP